LTWAKMPLVHARKNVYVRKNRDSDVILSGAKDLCILPAASALPATA
jgi:hypothetical protein